MCSAGLYCFSPLKLWPFLCSRQGSGECYLMTSLDTALVACLGHQALFWKWGKSYCHHYFHIQCDSSHLSQCPNLHSMKRSVLNNPSSFLCSCHDMCHRLLEMLQGRRIYTVGLKLHAVYSFLMWAEVCMGHCSPNFDRLECACNSYMWCMMWHTDFLIIGYRNLLADYLYPPSGAHEVSG
jgi:hypothetical protein